MNETCYVCKEEINQAELFDYIIHIAKIYQEGHQTFICKREYPICLDCYSNREDVAAHLRSEQNDSG